MICRSCLETFDVTEREKLFFKKMDLPPSPSRCPKCRRQRRLAFRNERKLYYRKCDESGKRIISLYPQEGKKKITAYDQKIWWDDLRWDPLKYGRDFDFNRPFFEQFAELKSQVPRPSLHNTNVENAIYGNHCVGNKDSYLNVGSDLCESCFFTYWAIRCKDCIDVSIAYDSELCYDCVDLRNGFNCFQVDNSEIMIDCHYCFDCKSCQDCFGCVGLRHKRFHFLNEPVSKEEYKTRMQYLKEHPETMTFFLQKYEELKKRIIYNANKNIQSEDVRGDRLFRCRQCADSFDLEKCDEVDHCTFGFDGVSSQDVDFFGQMQLCYENFSVFGQYNCIATILCHYSHDTFYSEYCISSHHLMGCISLHHKEYCILNKQYSKEGYLSLMEKIKHHIKETGEWGDFFPIEMSPFPYNVTVAQKYYPLTKEEVEKRGWDYEDPKTTQEEFEGAFEILPQDTSAVDHAIIGKVLKCEKTGRPYQIIRQEYEYLHARDIPLPRVHPDVRNEKRMERRNPQALFKRSCDNCGRATLGSFDPARGQIIYCQTCYEGRVINKGAPEKKEEPLIHHST